MYKTKQRGELIEFLETNSGKHITVSDVCEHFKAGGKNIGTATVYRQLEKMVDDGLVNKYIVDINSPACFEYIANDKGHRKEQCYHCKCEKCGKLIHLHCDDMVELQKHLLDEHDFVLNPARTVFYGLCSECADN